MDSFITPESRIGISRGESEAPARAAYGIVLLCSPVTGAASNHVFAAEGGTDNIISHFRSEINRQEVKGRKTNVPAGGQRLNPAIYVI